MICPHCDGTGQLPDPIFPPVVVVTTILVQVTCAGCGCLLHPPDYRHECNGRPNYTGITPQVDRMLGGLS